MTSATSNDDTTRDDTARLGKRKRKREKANDALRSELEAFKRDTEKRVRELEARVRKMEARVEVAETQRDAMRAELEEMRRTLEKEVKATRFGFSSLPRRHRLSRSPLSAGSRGRRSFSSSEP